MGRKKAVVEEKEIEKEIEEPSEVAKEEIKTDDVAVIDEEVKVDATEDITKEEIEVVKDEAETSSDPFAEWTSIFSEFNKEAPIETAIEWLNKDEIRMVAREEIKGWVKGVHEGKYPLPTGMIPKIEPIVEEASEPKVEVEVDSFPTKEFEALQDEIVDIKKSRDEASTKLEEVTKSLDKMKKEIEVIRDTPIDLVEKSIKQESPYEAKIAISRDGQITRRK